MLTKLVKHIILLLSLSILLTACRSATSTSQTPQAAAPMTAMTTSTTATLASATATTKPTTAVTAPATPTAIPTTTPTATKTTSTPRPTDTPEPTNTLQPTMDMSSLETIGLEMVWRSNIDPLDYGYCKKYDPYRDERDPTKTCLVLAMRESGASPEAITFAQLLGGHQYMSTFREMGSVDLATACLPFWPNSGQGCDHYLVNGTPRLIDVARYIWDIDLRAQPFYHYLELRFIERPAILWPVLFKTMEQLPQGGQRFIFQARLARGFYNASGAIGFADVAFDFDKNGQFLGTGILSIPVVPPPFSPDRKIVAQAEAFSVILWEVATRKTLETLKGSDGLILSLAFSPDGMILAGGTLSGTIELWDVATGRELKTIKGNSPVSSITFSPDGKTLAGGGEDGFVRFWEVATGKELKAFYAHKHPVLALAFSPDGKLLVSSSEAAWKEGEVEESAVKLREVVTGRELEVPELPGYVASVVFSPDGRTLAFGG